MNAADPPLAWAEDLRVTRLDAELRPARAWRLPPDPAVTLRGALGLAYLRESCPMEEPDCVGCPLRGSCLVPGWYDPGRVGSGAPRPLLPRVAQPEGARATPEWPLRVTFWLLGAVPEPSRLVQALVQLAREGLGPGRVVHSLTRLTVQGAGSPVSLVAEEPHPAEPRWPEPGALAQFCRLPPQPGGAVLTLRTPARWAQAHPQRAPSPHELILAALGRVRQLARVQDVRLRRWWSPPEGLPGRWTGLRWVEGSRYSARQGHPVDLSGWTGSLVLGPEVGPWADLLAAAEVLGVGRSTSAGRGEVSVEWLS